jgi:3-methyladenine DNA glycosylase AlkC
LFRLLETLVSAGQPLKKMIGVELAEDLARRIAAIYPTFAAESFVAQVAAAVDGLELKQRVAAVAAALRAHLPADYPEAIRILIAILEPERPAEEGAIGSGFALLPLAYFVEVYGLDHFAASLAALNAITRRTTAEFAIRPFLMRYPERTLAVLRGWAHDTSSHVRRLVSEGTRPRLPWAARLQAFQRDPTPVLDLLEHLKDDPSLYVRRSVANNLNDITKDHPALALATLERWNAGASAERRWIIRHALRGLVKQGNPDALRLLGADRPRVRLRTIQVDPLTLRVGETLTLMVELESADAEPQQLVVDYVAHFAGAGNRPRAKVFKLRTLTLAAGATVRLTRRHSFKPVTVRRYYPGRHRLDLHVNGVTLGGVDFMLLA